MVSQSPFVIVTLHPIHKSTFVKLEDFSRGKIIYALILQNDAANSPEYVKLNEVKIRIRC
jgi:hypothetical protein